MNLSMVSRTAAGLLLVGALAACSSSNDEVASTAAPAAPAPTTFTVAGTAATGAAFSNAAVTIITSDGTTYPTTGEGAVVTDADGSYTITLPLTALPPFVVQAARDDKTLVSVIAEAKDTTTNITPITNLIASRLSSSGDPAKLADEIKNKTVTVDAAAVKTKVDEIVALIKPLMDVVPGSTTDPLNGKLVADGTGDDKVLDSLSISITPSSATTANIEIAVKQKLADPAAQPEVITFTNATTATELAAKPVLTVTEANLVPSGNAALIADLLQRMTACYALPQADRVTTGGTAANIVATACKNLFVGNDPASFKNNGARVSSTGAWSSIFGTVTGVTFDRGSYEFTRSNPESDLVIAYRATSSAGSSNNTLVVRADTDGKLRAIGNQYKYNGGVVAYHQLRTFINQPAADYYSTGYVPNVNNVVDANRNSIFDKVVVTTPKGNQLTLKPTAGSSYLPLWKGTVATGTSFLRIRSVYVDAANSAKNPADADTTLFFANDATIDDAYIATIPAQASWKFEYYLASDPTVIDATQYYKTRARAMTIAELQTQPMANLADADIADVKASTLTSTATGGKYLPTPTAPDLITLDWVVPTGALAPTSIQVYGRTNNISFNDKVTVSSSSRTGTVSCSSASSADLHCTADGHFVAGGINGAHLWANDAAGREFAHFYAIYMVSIP